MIKKLLLGLLLVFSSTTPIFASEEFDTAFHTTYDIGLNGIATVTQNISLTNKKSNVYATQYALEIGSTRIESVVALDKGNRPIDHKITTTDNKTVIALSFQNKVVGKGQALEFIVKYKNLDASQKNGQILEINIPKVSPESQIDSYVVVINTPLPYGQPKIISPDGYKQTQSSNQTVLTFDNEQGKTQGVTAIFGELQVYDFNLTYNLENPTVSNAVTQVSLPPDTQFQKLYYNDFTTTPDSIKVDPDGNWIATFNLEPKEKTSVVVTGSAVIYMDPIVSVPQIDQKLLADYTRSQKFWDIGDPSVKQLAQELKTPKNIYDYLVDNFSYNYDRINSGIGRLGAVDALKYPQNAICTEFTDAFIAIARAANIPAREINGYAHTENSVLKPLSLIQDVLHSWPEYYDSQKKMWIPIDPTWGNTTGGIDYFSHLDFNHFVFAIHASSSERPYPAGYYKFANVDSKDLQITFGEQLPQPTTRFDVIFETVNFNPFSSIIPVKIKIKNISNQAFYQLPMSVSASNSQLITPSPLIISSILPYETVEYEVKLAPRESQASITINLGEQSFKHDINAIETRQKIIHNTGIVALGFVIAVAAFKSWRLLVSRQK